MDSPKSEDFFNLDRPTESKNAPSFTPETDIQKRVPPINPNAAERVNALPMDTKRHRQTECANAIVRECSWNRQDGTNTKSWAFGSVR